MTPFSSFIPSVFSSFISGGGWRDSLVTLQVCHRQWQSREKVGWSENRMSNWRKSERERNWWDRARHSRQVRSYPITSRARAVKSFRGTASKKKKSFHQLLSVTSSEESQHFELAKMWRVKVSDSWHRSLHGVMECVRCCSKKLGDDGGKSINQI